MPIEQLQKLLGHQRIDTTLQYAMVKQSNVKIAHRKYIGCLPKQQGDKYCVSDESIIIARSGIPGATRILCNPGSNIIFCGFIICCTPYDNTLQNYLTLYLRQFEGSSATQTGGSILKNVSQETLKNLIVPIPPQSLLNQFNWC